ncbi:hypothetical protein METHP14_30115 [Pseudomonas sp. P14-2025]
MQVRPEHATAFFTHVVQSFVAGFVSAAQVKGYVDQSVLGRNVWVDGEEWIVAGIAVAEGAGGGAWERWIGDYFLHHWKMLLKAANPHYHVNGWRLYARW